MTTEQHRGGEVISPPHDILETRTDKVRLIRRYADSGKVSEAVLDEMIQDVRDYEELYGLSTCEIYNRQSY